MIRRNAPTSHRLYDLTKEPGALSPGLFFYCFFISAFCHPGLTKGIVQQIPYLSGNAGQMFLPYVRRKYEKLLKYKEEMSFDVYWDGACGADKIKEFAPFGVKGFVLGTTLLFGKNKSYKESIDAIRALDI